MRIVTSAEMREIEEMAADRYGLTNRLIIETVGLRGSEFIFENHLSENEYGEIVVLVGKGHNGADGLAVARHLKRFNMSVRVFQLFPEEECTEEFKYQLAMAKSYGVKNFRNKRS